MSNCRSCWRWALPRVFSTVMARLSSESPRRNCRRTTLSDRWEMPYSEYSDDRTQNTTSEQDLREHGNNPRIGTIGVEVVVANLEVNLTADEGESLAQFEQEPLQVGDQALLEVPLSLNVGLAKEVEQVRSRVACWARSESPGGRVAAKLLIAVPVRSCNRVAMWWARTSRVQPLATAACAYHKRRSRLGIFSRSAIW